MASDFQFGQTVAEQDDLRAMARDDRMSDDFLGPVLAGAFARGVADTFGLLGIPALFLDREGHVLFVTEAATARLGGALRIRSGHLLASARDDNRALADFVAQALRDAAARPVVTLDSAGMSLQALPAPGALRADQLLHAIVVLSDRAPSARAAAA